MRLKQEEGNSKCLYRGAKTRPRLLGQHPENQETAGDYLSSVVLCVESLIQRCVERYFTQDL